MEHRVRQLGVRRDTVQELEEAGTISINKAFVERKPRTFGAATAAGRKVFQQHVVVLESIPRGN
jgi:hypothetical protein